MAHWKRRGARESPRFRVLDNTRRSDPFYSTRTHLRNLRTISRKTNGLRELRGDRREYVEDREDREDHGDDRARKHSGFIGTHRSRN